MNHSETRAVSRFSIVPLKLALIIEPTWRDRLLDPGIYRDSRSFSSTDWRLHFSTLITNSVRHSYNTKDEKNKQRGMPPITETNEKYEISDNSLS